MDRKIQFMKHNDFLSKTLSQYCHISDYEIDLIIPKITKRNINRNDHFLNQGDNINRICLIREGLFRVYCNDLSGDEKTLAFRSQGQFLAGYSPFIENKEIWYSIEALEDSVILEIRFKDYLDLVRNSSSWNELIKNYMTLLFIEKEERERSFLLDDATTRYLEFIRKNPEFEDRIPQFNIASYLGITPVSLSRIRSKLKKNKSDQLS
jgi:CRP-like cAMP-binding protein